MFAFLGQWGWPGMVIIAVIILVLFGTRGQIPAFMRDIGRGINSFRSGLKEGAEETRESKDALEETASETVDTTAKEKTKDT